MMNTLVLTHGCSVGNGVVGEGVILVEGSLGKVASNPDSVAVLLLVEGGVG